MATKLYIRNTPSQTAVGTDLTSLLDKNSDGALYSHIKATAAGVVTPPTTGTQFTKTNGGTVETWLSPPVEAVTISGSVTFNIWAQESNNTANATVTAELLRCDGSGVVQSTIAAVNTTNTELTTSVAAKNWSVTPTSTALSDGDRLAVRIHIDDGSGVTMGSGQTVTAGLNQMTAAANGDTYVQVTETVLYTNPTFGFRQAAIGRRNAAGSSTQTVVLADVQVGSRIVVFTETFATTVTQIADSGSNSGATAGKYDLVTSQTEGTNQLALYCYTVPVTTGGDLTITVTQAATNTQTVVVAAEYAGLSTSTGSSAWDGASSGGATNIPSATNMSTGATAAASGTGMAAAAWFDTAATLTTPGTMSCTASGYVNRAENLNGTSFLGAVLYDHQTTNGNTETATFQRSSSADSANFWAAIVVAIKPAAVSTTPFKNPAVYQVQVSKGGRPARRRVGYWHWIVDSTSPIIAVTAAEAPQRTLGRVLTAATPHGRPQRRRVGQWHRNEGATQTAYKDVVMSQADDRGWRSRVPLLRGWQTTGNWFANLLQFAIPPYRQLAGFWVISGRGRRPRRAGFWHQVVDWVAPVLVSQAEGIQANPAAMLVQTGRGGRPARRRVGAWHRASTETQTLYQDAVLSNVEDRSWRQRVARFKVSEQSVNAAVNFLLAFPPFRQLAAWYVQTGRGGRAARRRVGFWHQVVDRVSTGLVSSAEVGQIQPADVMVQSGRKRPARRRVGAWHQATAETYTVYQDVVVSQVQDRGWRQRVQRFRVSEQSVNLLATVLIAFPPLRQLAAWWVQSNRGGRPARRRVGYWHQVIDQVNTRLLDAAEAKQVQPADVLVQMGRKRPARRRVGQWHQASTETHTIYADRVIGSTADRSWRQYVARFRNWDQPASRFTTWLGQPFRQLASIWTMVGKGRRPRRPGSWHETVDYVNTTMLLTAEQPQRQPAEAPIQSSRRGRAARRRTGQWHQASQETHTTYQERVISVPRAQDRRHRFPSFRDWDQQPGSVLGRIISIIGTVPVNLPNAIRLLTSGRVRELFQQGRSGASTSGRAQARLTEGRDTAAAPEGDDDVSGPL